MKHVVGQPPHGAARQKDTDMAGHLIVATFALLALFIMFLVLTRTLNNILNHLIKLEYLLRKEHDIIRETISIKKLLAKQTADEQAAIAAREE